MNDSGQQDVDFALTVQELAKMIKAAGVDFLRLVIHHLTIPLD
jgi:iron only hydrogenase large subunit-like protein